MIGEEFYYVKGVWDKIYFIIDKLFKMEKLKYII